MLGHGATGQFAIGEVGAGTAENITPDKWYEMLSEPPRFLPGLRAGQQQFTAFNPLPFVNFSWPEPLSEPVRFRPALPAGEQQFLAFNPLPFVSFGWFEELSIPSVRTKPGLLPPLQQFFAADTTVIPTSKLIEWFQALSEPPRFPRALPPGEHQFTALNPLPRVSFGWYEGLSEPVHFPPALRAALQQFYAADTTVIPTTKLMEWFAGLSEPVRFKPALLAALQQFLAHPPQIRPTPTTTATLNALETKDTMLAGARVYNAVLSGEVGVYEAKSPPGEIGINVPTVTRASVAITIL
jgi:hypothetical protein